MTIFDCLQALSLPRLFLWVSITIGIAFTVISLYRLNRAPNDFRIEDLITEGNPPKASLNKLILLVFAGLSVWITVNAALDNKIDPSVVNLLLGVLGIFVIGRAANQAVAQFSARPRMAEIQNINKPASDDLSVEEQEARRKPVSK